MSNPHQKKIEEIKEKVSKEELYDLLDYPNAIRYSFGFAEHGGQMYEEPSIIVWVSEKVDEADLDEDDVLPSDLYGFQVDVKVDDSDSFTPETVGQRGSEKVRPVVGGHDVSSESDVSGATMGGVGFTDEEGDPVMITNTHVAVGSDVEEDEGVGQKVIQPSDRNGGSSPDDDIGTVKRHGGIPGGTGTDDVAYVEVDSGVETNASSFAAADFGEFEDPQLGEWYINNGRTHGHLFGQCYDVGSDTSSARFARSMPDSWGGHSGSLWCRVDDETDTFYPVSVHRAGVTNDDPEDNAGVGVPYELMRERFLDVEVDDTTGQPDGSDVVEDDAYHEIAPHHFRRTSDGDVICELYTGNSGGEGSDRLQDTGEYIVEAEDGTTLFEQKIDNEQYEHTFVEFEFDEQYIDDILTFRTRTVNSDTVNQEYEFGLDHERSSGVRDYFFGITITDVPSSVDPGSTVDVEYEIENTLSGQGSQDITFRVDSQVEEVNEGRLVFGDATVSDSFEWQVPDEVGTYTLEIESDDDSDETEVTAEDEAGPFLVQNFDGPSQVEPDEEYTVSADILNDGSISGDVSAEYILETDLIDDELIEDLGTGESESVSFTHSISDSGEYTHSIETHDDFVEETFEVVEEANLFPSITDVNDPVEEGQLLEVTVDVSNDGGESDNDEAELFIDGTVEDEVFIEDLAPGDSETITLEYQTVEGDAGQLDVEVVMFVSGESDSTTAEVVAEESFRSSTTTVGPITASAESDLTEAQTFERTSTTSTHSILNDAVRLSTAPRLSVSQTGSIFAVSESVEERSRVSTSTTGSIITKSSRLQESMSQESMSRSSVTSADRIVSESSRTGDFSEFRGDLGQFGSFRFGEQQFGSVEGRSVPVRSSTVHTGAVTMNAETEDQLFSRGSDVFVRSIDATADRTLGESFERNSSVFTSPFDTAVLRTLKKTSTSVVEPIVADSNSAAVFSRSSELFTDQIRVVSNSGVPRWVINGNQLYELQEEVRTWQNLILTFRAQKEIVKDRFRPLFSDAGQVDVIESIDGGFDAVDRAGGDNEFDVQSPFGREQVRPVEQLYLEDYSEAAVGRDGDFWEVEMELVADQEKLYDNVYGTFDGSLPNEEPAVNQWYFEFEEGSFNTSRVTADVDRSHSGSIEEAELEIFLLTEEVRILEENLGLLAATNLREVPDGKNVMVDESSGSRNTVVIDSPADAEDVVEGTFVVDEWEVEFNLASYLVTLTVRAEG